MFCDNYYSVFWFVCYAEPLLIVQILLDVVGLLFRLISWSVNLFSSASLTSHNFVYFLESTWSSIEFQIIISFFSNLWCYSTYCPCISLRTRVDIQLTWLVHRSWVSVDTLCSITLPPSFSLAWPESITYGVTDTNMMNILCMKLISGKPVRINTGSLSPMVLEQQPFAPYSLQCSVGWR